MQTVKSNAILHTSCGQTCRVVRFAARGGQGEVYEGEFQGRKVAVKVWFAQAIPPRQQAFIAQELCGREPPDPAFVFPLAMLKSTVPGIYLGYVMDFVDLERYKPLKKVISPKLSTSLESIVSALVNFCRCFGLLHGSYGFCYRDISFDNLAWLAASKSGPVMILDPDNIRPPRMDLGSGLMGTFGTMSPEVVCKKAPPSTDSDLHSLAVIVFYMLTRGEHPLMSGKCAAKYRIQSIENLTLLQGEKPVYVFDRENKSNRPTRHQHQRLLFHWAGIPAFIKELFDQAFTVGLHKPNRRVTVPMWTDALLQLRDLIVRCPHCRYETFAEHHAKPQKLTCDKCRKRFSPQHYLSTTTDKNRLVAASPGSKLYTHHFEKSKKGVDEPVGFVERHPKHRSLMAVRNLCDAAWNIALPSGEALKLPPQKRVVVKPGLRISVGTGAVTVVS